MKNEERIIMAAVKSGLYTKKEIERIKKEKKEVPLHTLGGWISRTGRKYSVKKGEKGLKVSLWKKKTDGTGFFLITGELFTEKQLEEV